MKYPFRVVAMRNMGACRVGIADASGAIICQINSNPWDNTLAQFIVRAANRWHKLRPWFRPYTRNDWKRERAR